MTIELSTALSGLSAANERLRASAGNIARLSTGNNAQREQVDQATIEGGGVSTTSRIVNQPVEANNEIVEQQSATYSYVANLKVLQTQLRAEGSLLDIHV
ncbi:hypothetical protein [Pelomonas sp. KK5]|uniref:hypothetical protein n=1 Tax=Pelomonas sp. KK5 TaxID=1855730 RepID=UPI00097C007E|nr:hypothetical protein [Pelomonas sp. KK5]